MEDKIVTESKKTFECVLNLSLKQIKDEDLSVDVKEAIAEYLEPLLEKWRQDLQEKDKMSKLEKEQGSNKSSDATVAIDKQDYIRNHTNDNVNINPEAGDVSKYEGKEAGDLTNYKDREGGGEVSKCEDIAAGEVSKCEDIEAVEVSKCEDSSAGEVSKCKDREAIDVSKYENCFSPSTGLYCFQATTRIKSYQFTLADAGIISRVISPQVKDIIIMNKVRKSRRSTIQIGALVEGGVQQLAEAIDTANDVLGREKGFLFSPIDNRKDIFSVLGRKAEMPRVDANGVYQLQVKFALDDTRKEDKARVAAEMGRRLERLLDNVLVEKICRGPGEMMLLFSHTSDIAAARRKLGGSPELIVDPSKHVWTPRKMEVPVDTPKHVLKSHDEMEESVEEKKKVVSLLMTADKRKNNGGGTFKKMKGVIDAAKDVSCHGRRVDIIFNDAELALSFFQDIGKLNKKMWSHSVLISLEELGSLHTPSITEGQIIRLAGFNHGDVFNSREKMTVSTEDEKLIFSFESVDSANAFIFTKSCNKKLLNSLGQLKGTSMKDEEYTIEADEEGFYTLHGPLDKFHAELLSELNFQDFKITSSSNYKKVYILLHNKVSMLNVALSQSARQMELKLHKIHFVKVNAAPAPFGRKSQSVDAVKSLVEEIVKAALDGIDQKVRRPNDDKGSTDKEHDQSFERAAVFVNSINQVQTDDKKSLFSNIEKKEESKNAHEVIDSSVKPDENSNRKENRVESKCLCTSEEDQKYQVAYLEFDKSIDIVQALIREIFEQVFVGKEHKELKFFDNLSHTNTDFECNLKSETSIDTNLTSIKEDFLEMTRESSVEDASHDTEK